MRQKDSRRRPLLARCYNSNHPMEAPDYRERRYLSAVEAAKFLGVSTRAVHQLVSEGVLPAQVAASGQYRFDIRDLKQVRLSRQEQPTPKTESVPNTHTIQLNQTTQTIYVKNAQSMTEIAPKSVHLVAPFPVELPYRLIKAYSYIGETVLDPFVGSGATLLAAAMLERNGIGYEINPIIAGGALERLHAVMHS